jgi:hypothetical protein
MWEQNHSSVKVIEVHLARGVGKWKKQGYAIEIVKVTCLEALRLSE